MRCDRLPLRRWAGPACAIVLAAACAPATGRPAGGGHEEAGGVRQGPYAVVCYKDDAVVFEHPAIFRVYRPSGDDIGWSYETRDGLKFRGRIGENVTCVWR